MDNEFIFYCMDQLKLFLLDGLTQSLFEDGLTKSIFFGWINKL